MFCFVVFLSSRKKTIHTTPESTRIWKYNDSESTLATHFIKYNDYESTLATHMFKNNDYESTLATHVFENNDYESTLATHLKNNDYESTLPTYVQKYPRVHPRLTSPRLRVVVVRRVQNCPVEWKYLSSDYPAYF